MVETEGPLSMRRQCELLRINRSTLYYEPVATPDEDLELMRKLDELHLEHPFYGSRRMAAVLGVNRKRVQRLMRIIGIEGLAPKPSTSTPAPEHPVFPYLLRHRKIERSNEVWAADITYVPMEHGFAYLVVIMDWHSRRVLAWRLSNSMDVRFCLEALEEAIERFGPPEIFNTDQGAQFTASTFDVYDDVEVDQTVRYTY